VGENEVRERESNIHEREGRVCSGKFIIAFLIFRCLPEHLVLVKKKSPYTSKDSNLCRPFVL